MSHRVKPSVSYLLIYLVGVAGFLTGFAGQVRASEAPDVAGHWEGKINLPGTPLGIDVDFVFQGGVWTGDISIPMQNAEDLPLAELQVDGGSVAFQIKGIPGTPTFKGTVSDDGKSISGDFTQGGMSAPFELKSGIDLAAKATQALDGFGAVIDQTLKDFMVPGLAVGVIADDQVVWAKGFGFRDVDNQKPITSKTLLAIGSCTKAFTTFTLATLADEGKLDWDKPVRSYLPDFKLYDDYATLHITPRDLVTHRSGLPRHDMMWYNNHKWSRAEFVRRLRYLEPNKELRETFQYNNLMFLTAGYLVEELTGNTWEHAVQARILTPLGMTATNFSVKDSQKTADYALPYKEDEDKLELMHFRMIDVMGPAGSINSNVEDMNRWMRVHLNEGKLGDKQIIKPTALDELHTPQMVIRGVPKDAEFSPNSYAMGWGVDTYRGKLRVRHGGNIDGFSAMVTLFPRDSLGIVTLANKNATPVPGLIALAAADRIFGFEGKDHIAEALEKRKLGKEVTKEAEKKKGTRQIPNTKPSHPIEDYVGTYENPGYGLLHITADGDKLTMSIHGISAPLMHWHYDVFKCRKNPEDDALDDIEIQFRSNEKGAIDSVRAPFEPSVSEIRFTKRPDERLSDPVYLSRFVGDYQLGPQTVTVSLQGDHLLVTVPGQPSVRLIPDVSGEFNLEGLTGYSAAFTEKDGAISAVFNQPNGVFELKRVPK